MDIVTVTYKNKDYTLINCGCHGGVSVHEKVREFYNPNYPYNRMSEHVIDFWFVCDDCHKKLTEATCQYCGKVISSGEHKALGNCCGNCDSALLDAELQRGE